MGRHVEVATMVDKQQGKDLLPHAHKKQQIPSWPTGARNWTPTLPKS